MALIDLKNIKTNMLKKLASFSNWQGRQFAIQVAGKGFSYTGRDAVVMCDTCNALVDMKVKDVVSLADEHDRCCRIKEYLKRMMGNPFYEEDITNLTNEGQTANHTYEGQTANHTYEGETANTTIERQTTYSTNDGRTTGPTYEEEAASYTNFPNIGHTTPIISGYWKDDLAIYPRLASIINAPSVCPCLICYHSTDLIRIEEETDMNICKKISGNRLVLILQRQLEYNNNQPLRPEFEAPEVRKSSFRNTNVDSQDVDCQTKSGFYCLENGSRECFYCGICLCEEYLKFDPFKEHARWSPFCPHVLQLRGKEFVHDVIDGTRMLKNYLKGLNRPTRMELSVVEEAMKYYPQYIVSEAIEGFFIEYGSFPNWDELLDVLESRRLWKTCESYDYCRY